MPQGIHPIVFDISPRLERSFLATEAMLEEFAHHPDIKVRLAVSAELRQHKALVDRIFDKVTSVEAQRDFEAGVLEALADANITVRRKIMGLFEARAAEPDEKPDHQSEPTHNP